jgi:hypothetical protein
MQAAKRTFGGNNAESVCRLCSSNSGIIVLNIFDGEGKKRRILSLINACLPVKVCLLLFSHWIYRDYLL